MNLEQYRALKAQEAQESANTPTQPAIETPIVQQPNTIQPIDNKPIENKTEENKSTLPEKINIEGVGEVTLDELKNGYLRQSDYTRKTQDVSRKAKEVEEAVAIYEQLKLNPQITQQIFKPGQVPATLDPTQSKLIEVENKLYDMMLEREIESLQSKYSDFEVKEVLEMAQSKNITNLEDAYVLAKSHKQKPQTTDEVKKQLREEILKEIEQERSATHSIISSGDSVSVIKDNTPVLSEVERNVARKMKMSEADYAKWRDAGRKK